MFNVINFFTLILLNYSCLYVQMGLTDEEKEVLIVLRNYLKEVFPSISSSMNSLYSPKCCAWYCTAENQEFQRVAQGFGGMTAFFSGSLFVMKQRYLLFRDPALKNIWEKLSMKLFN